MKVIKMNLVTQLVNLSLELHLSSFLRYNVTNKIAVINNHSWQFFRGLKNVFEEKYVKKYKIQPLRYVGFVGIV